MSSRGERSETKNGYLVVKISLWCEKCLFFFIVKCVLIFAVVGLVCFIVFISLTIGVGRGRRGLLQRFGSVGGNGVTSCLLCSHGGPRPGAL